MCVCMNVGGRDTCVVNIWHGVMVLGGGLGWILGRWNGLGRGVIFWARTKAE